MIRFKEWFAEEVSQEQGQEFLASPEFKQWIASLGIEGDVDANADMAGGAGRAYPLGDKYIVKFTSDDREAQAAAALKKKPSDSSPTIHDVRQVSQYYFAIVMEKLNTNLSGKHRIASKAVADYINQQRYENPNEEGAYTVRDLDTEAEEAMNFVRPKFQRDPDIRRLVYQTLEGIYNTQKQSGITPNDAHVGNIGLKDRKPAVFDLGLHHAGAKARWDRFQRMDAPPPEPPTPEPTPVAKPQVTQTPKRKHSYAWNQLVRKYPELAGEPV